MSYATHLRRAILAYKAAVPGMSDRSLSLEAGLGAGWVNQFLENGSGTLTRADRILAVMRRNVPEGGAGDELRDLLDRLDGAAPGADDTGVAA